jgi:hypothetical protein
MTPSKQPKRQSLRWMPVLLLTLFVAWQVRAGDFWGAAFGGLGLAYALVAPHEELGAPRWRVYGVRLLTIVFIGVAVLAIWQTLASG